MQLPHIPSDISLKIPSMIAHRGTRVWAPENTLSAFKIAHQLGATWLECDLQLSRDGEIYVFHDELLERTTNGVGRLSDWDSDRLDKLDAGSWFSNDFVGERIPSFTQLLLFAKVSQMGLNLELKPMGVNTETLVTKVLEALTLNAFPREKLLISSFSLPTLTLLRHYDPQLALGWLCDKWPAGWQKTAACLQVQAFIGYHKIMTEKRITAIHEAGMLALAYTVNHAKRRQQLREWGIDAVFVDDPRLFL